MNLYTVFYNRIVEEIFLEYSSVLKIAVLSDNCQEAQYKHFIAVDLGEFLLKPLPFVIE